MKRYEAERNMEYGCQLALLAHNTELDFVPGIFVARWIYSR